MYNAAPVKTGWPRRHQYSGRVYPDFGVCSVKASGAATRKTLGDVVRCPILLEVPTASPLLETVRLACERDWRIFVQRLDLRLAAGEMLQVVGPSSSSKTSLLRLLSGLMQPTAGKSRPERGPLAEQRGELARSLLWISHAAGIKGLLSAEENLTGSARCTSRPAARRFWRALADVGLRWLRGRSLPHPFRRPATPRGLPACTWTHRPCGSSMNPSPPSTNRGWRNWKRTWPGIASAAGW